MQEYMNVAIFEARKSLEKEDIPVGAIIPIKFCPYK